MLFFMKILYFFIAAVILTACSTKSGNTAAIESEKDPISYIQDNGLLPRTIYGCTLGETGIAHAKQILIKQGFNVEEGEDDKCPILGFDSETQCIKYLNEDWNGVMFAFCDNKLVRVFFMKNNVSDKLFDEIKDKCSNLYIVEKKDDSEKGIYVNDDNTSWKLTKDPDFMEGFSQLTITDFLRNNELPMRSDNMSDPF